jgi:hypothetical protein
MFEAIWHLEFNATTGGKYAYDYLYATDKASPFPAGWHPGPHGHRLRAEILAYYFMDVLKRALLDARGVVTAGPAAVAERLQRSTRWV